MITAYTSESGAESVFEILRGEIAIERLIETNGQRKALCVSHSEKTPSLHVYDDHVHCFGCRFHGDVVDVWAVQRRIDRPIEAALDLAREFNVQLPAFSEEGGRKAEMRRRKEEKDLATARMLLKRLKDEISGGWAAVEWWEGRGFTSELRNRFLLSGTPETAVIPFWRRGGRIFGFIRRHLDEGPKYQNPEGEKSLFVPTPIKGELFLVEGYIDALAVAATDRNAIAVGGTNISDAQRAELQRIVQEGATIYILPDNDESGAEAARAWGRAFFPNAKICAASYGEGAKDIADNFAREGAQKTGEQLDWLMATSKDMIDIETEVAASIEGGVREKLAYSLENIVPLLARIGDDALRDATADIVVDQVKGLKKNWLTKAIKVEEGRVMAEMAHAMMQKAEAEAAQKAEEHRLKVASAQKEIDERLAKPGVLGKLRDAAAKMHNVRRDEKALELALLVALGAQPGAPSQREATRRQHPDDGSGGAGQEPYPRRRSEATSGGVLLCLRDRQRAKPLLRR